MNSSALRRLVSVMAVSLTVVPLWTLILVARVQAAAAPAAPAAAASTVAAKSPTSPTSPAAPGAAAPGAAAPGPASAAASAAGSGADADDEQPETQKRHRENNLVTLGRDSHLPPGQRADSVVSILGSSTSEGDAGEVVSIIGDTRVTGSVDDSAVSVLGNAYVDGKIGGDVVVVLGNLELGPHAEVDGDVVAVGGSLQRDAAAVVHGDVQNIIAGDFGSVGGLRTWIRHCLLYGRPLAFVPGIGWAWGLAFTCLALYAVLALLFREGLVRCVETFDAQPGQAALAALIAMLLTPVLVVLLCITVIGIPAVPFVLLGLFCTSLFGKAVMLAWVGRRVTGSRGAAIHPVVAVLIGGMLVLVLYTVPVLGFLFYKLLGFLGLGAVIYTLIAGARQRKAHRQPGSPHAPAAAAATGAAATPDPLPMSGSTPTTGDAPGADAPGAAGAASPGPSPGPIPAPSISAASPRAGFWVRMGALLLDALLVGFCLHVLDQHHLELVVLAAYGALMWKLKGTTVGGLVFDLQVVRLDGRPVDWETAIIRALSCFLSLVVAGLGFLWIVFDDNKQAWHDKIAGTVVVRVAKGIPLV